MPVFREARGIPSSPIFIIGHISLDIFYFLLKRSKNDK